MCPIKRKLRIGAVARREAAASSVCMRLPRAVHSKWVEKSERVGPSNAMNRLSWLCSKSCYVKLRTVLYCMHACMFAFVRSTTARLVHHMPNVCNVHRTLNKPKIIRKCQRYIVHSTEMLSFNSFAACFGFFPFHTESLGLFYFYIFIISLNPTAFLFMLMLRLHCPFRK